MKSLQNISYKTLFTILFFAIAGIVFFLKIGGKTQKVSAAWWDEMWHYRKAISIENSSGADLTDFQVSISIGTSQLIADGKMQTDCDDIRITDINGNLLPYWIEENNPGCNKVADTKIWLKATSLPTSGATIYIYYGNQQASNSENGNNVFEIFDDFNDNNISDWTQQAGGTWTVSGGIVSTTTSDGKVMTKDFSQSTTNQTLVVNGKVKIVTDTNYNDVGVGIVNSGLNGYMGVITNDDYIRVNRVAAGARNLGVVNTSFDSGTSPWTIEYTYKGTEHSVSLQENGLGGSVVDTTYSNLTKIALYHQTYGTGGKTAEYDWVLARKYTSPNPITTPQSEETSVGAPVAYWKFNEGVGTTVYDSSSYRNDGILVSAPIWKNENECVSEKCLSFNGDDSINLPNDIDYKNTVSAFTWFKSSGAPVGGYHIIFGGQELEMSISTGGILRTGVYTNTRYVSDHGSGLTDGQWHYVGFTFDGSTKKTYIDGRFVGEQTGIGGTLVSSFSSRTIGKFGSSNSYFLNGYLDEPKIYDYARTADQIKLDYNSRGSISGSSVNLGSNKSVSFPDTGLIGYWDFEENTGTVVKDKSGNNNTGTFGAGNAAPSWGLGKVGSATNFDGSDDYIDIGDSLPSFNGGMTVSLWVYPRTAANFARFLDLGNGPGSNNILFYREGTTNNLVFSVYNGASALPIVASGVIELNKWQNFAATVDNSGNAKIYKNGTLIASGTTYIPTNIVRTINYIGRSNWVGDSYYNGLIDNVKIYSYVRNQKQIFEDMNEGDPSTSAKSMAAYYKFDEGTGSTVFNSSSNQSNGTITGATWQNESQCVSGKCLLFDGVDDYVSTSLGKINTSTQGGITMSAWIKTTSSKNYNFIMGKGNMSSGNIAINVLGMQLYSTRLNFVVSNGNSTGWCQQFSTGPIVPTDGTWHHVASVFNKDLQMIYNYVDGVQMQSIACNQTGDSESTSAFFVGMDSTGYLAGAFDGSIDNAKVYSSALTPQEILVDYNQGAAIKFSTSNQTISGTTTSLDYCIPGDTSYCAPPVAEYNFEENTGTVAKDTSGNNNNGSITSATWIPGKTGSGLSFNGSSSYVNLGTSSILGSTSFTVSTWFKQTATISDTYYGCLISRTSTSGYFDNYNIFIDKINNYLGARIGFGGTTEKTFNGVTNVYDNKWHHTALTVYYDGFNTTMILYLDGKVEAQATQAGIPYTSSSLTTKLGMYGSQFFPGLMDNIRIYNYVRTPAQIAYDYNKGEPVIRYKFDECQNNIANNTSSSRLGQCIISDTASSCVTASLSLKLDKGSSGFISDDNNNNYIPAVNPIWTTGHNGKKFALDFNGSSSYLGPISSGNTPYSSWSVSAWVYLRAAIGDQGAFIGNYGGNYLGWTLYRGPSYTGVSVGEGPNSVKRVDVSTSFLPLNTWVYVVGTYANSTLKFYTDGVLRGQLSGVNAASWGSQSIYIGKESWTSVYTNGIIDEVMISNKALTPEQIMFDYKRGLASGSGLYDGTVVIGPSGTQNSLGTCVAGGTTAAWFNGSVGKNNSSLNLDGTDDYVSISDYNLTKNATISVWVKGSYANGDQVIVGSPNSISLGLYNIGSTKALIGSAGISKSVGIAHNFINDSWNHLAVVFDSSGNAKYYCNGEMLSTSGTNYWSWTSGSYIGRRDSGDYFKGKIDDIRIYNYALTSKQLSQISSGGVATFK